jgi:flagellar basal-body rod protein FlgG
MIRGIYQNASSMVLLENKTEVLANNIANVDTAGFKKKGVFFQQVIAAEEILKRNELQVELPEGATPTYVQYTDGKLQQTGNPLDIAIKGDGFLTVQTENGEAYTRAGSLRLNQSGQLIMPDGNAVLGESGPIELNGENVQINQSGDIIVDGVIINRLMLKTFDTRNAIEMDSNYYRPKDETEVTSATAEVHQGFLEKSNVNIIAEMTELIASQRHYEANQKLVRAQDDTLDKTVNQVGK